MAMFKLNKSSASANISNRRIKRLPRPPGDRHVPAAHRQSVQECRRTNAISDQVLGQRHSQIYWKPPATRPAWRRLENATLPGRGRQGGDLIFTGPTAVPVCPIEFVSSIEMFENVHDFVGFVIRSRAGVIIIIVEGGRQSMMSTRFKKLWGVCDLGVENCRASRRPQKGHILWIITKKNDHWQICPTVSVSCMM